jgi:DNA-binding XRE family transcriptional regulator
MNNAKKILQEIEKVRAYVGVTQYEIIQNTSLTKMTVHGIKHVEISPTLGVLCEYCNYLGLDIKIVPRQELVATEKPMLSKKTDFTM